MKFNSIIAQLFSILTVLTKMKATKTFKIGEYAIGGIIKVDISGQVLAIKALDWNSKKEVLNGSFTADESDARLNVFNFLNELTSSYYSDKIIQWIESKIELNKNGRW